eukprot:GEMP01001964.1.p1 GENE.GEMP01001964.1~~GEMP01001964.1.p1  ORF type:complete len:1291 (+),score=257.22 GEMP01001964.1:218-4090(+)
MVDYWIDRFVHVPQRNRFVSPVQASSQPFQRGPNPDHLQVSALEEARSAVDLHVCELVPALKAGSVVFEDDVVSEEEKDFLGGHKPLRMRAATEADGSPAENKHEELSIPTMRGTVGVLIAGESASVGGVTNALVGLVRYCCTNSIDVVGFSGPQGLFKGICEPISWESVRIVVNRGGSDVLPTGTFEGQVDGEKAMKVCTALNLIGLVVIAGPTDMSWTAELSDIFTKNSHPTTLIGIPKSKNANFYIPRYLPITLGFDSARRSLGEVAGNVAVDSISSKKYWHFICCGDAALTMEVSLSIRATLCIAKEDMELQKLSIEDVIKFVADLVMERQKHGRYSGVVLLSDGFVKNHSDVTNLRAEIETLGEISNEDVNQLSEKSRAVLNVLPKSVQRSLLFKRTGDGRSVLPYIEPEKFLGRSVAKLLAERDGGIEPSTFAPRFHYMGREASSCVPTSFDCELGMALGMIAGSMVTHKIHGHIACVQNLTEPIDKWECSALPFDCLRSDSESWKIEKTGWHLRQGIRAAYAHFRREWIENSVFRCPGPVQFTGDDHSLPLTLLAETKTVEELIKIVQPVCTEKNRYYSIELRGGNYESSAFHNAPNEPKRQMNVDIRNIENMSTLERERREYEPRLPSYLSRAFLISEAEITGKTCNNAEFLEQIFPHTNHLDAIQIVPKPPRANAEQHFDLESRITLAGGPPKVSRMSPHHGYPRQVSCASASSVASHEQTSAYLSEGVPGRCRLFHGPDRRLNTKHKKFQQSGIRPLRVGILFGGNQVPGNHNVVAGLFEYLQSLEPKAELIGFLGGWHGLMTSQFRVLDKEKVALHRNLGGQELLCQFQNAGIKNSQDLKRCLNTLDKLNLDGLVITGHLSTHLETAFLAEACEAEEVMTRVVACPVSAESDFAFVQQTVGKDTVAKVFSSIIGALGSEAKASRDNWYFARIKCHGGVGCLLECALQTQATHVLLPEQVGKQCLGDLIRGLCDFIMQRAQQNKNFGVILIPDTLLACISETHQLLREIDEILRLLDDERQNDPVTENVQSRLKRSTQTIFKAFPHFLQEELCTQSMDGSVDLSNVSTEKLILAMVDTEMDRRRRLGYEVAFKGSCHELAYQGRSAMPTNFDCDLAYSLGFACGILVDGCRNGYLVHASDLRKQPEHWKLGAIPLISLVTTEQHSDGTQAAIMESTMSSTWSKSVLDRLPHPLERMCINPGPTQFSILQNDIALTLSDHNPTAELIEVAQLMAELQSIAATAEDLRTVDMVSQILENGVRMLRTFKEDAYMDAPPVDGLR